MFVSTVKHVTSSLVLMICIGLVSQAHAGLLIDNLNTANITACQFGFIPIQGNQYRIRAPGVSDSAHPHRGQCNSSYYYGIGNEHDYINTADVGNLGSVISLIRTNWLDQALTINLANDNDSSVLRFIYDGIDNNVDVNSHGLGGLDFTASQDNVLRIRLLTSSSEATVRVALYEDDLNYSFIYLNIPNSENSYRYLDLFLADFQDVGAGVDLSAVNSIEFEFVNTATDTGTGVYPGQLISNIAVWTAICDVIGEQCQQLHHALGVDHIEVNKQLETSALVEVVDDLNGDGDIDSTGDDGDTFRYSVTITNTEDLLAAPATNLVYSSAFDPAYVSFLPGSVQTDKGTVISGNTIGDSTVEVNIGDLVDAESVTISYEMKVNSGFHNTADVSYSHYGTINSDLWAAYDTEPFAIEFNQFDIATSLTAAAEDDADNDGFAGPGERVRFTATIDNDGPNASSVVFYFPEIANASLVVGSVSTDTGNVVLGNTAGNTEVEVSIPSLDPAVMATISFELLINEPFFFALYDSIGGQALLTDDSNTYSVLSDDPGILGDEDATYALVDAFPDRADARQDNDGDGLPENCNPACVDEDPFPNDTNNDGIPNDPDNPLADDDGDGVPNGEDAFPFHAEAWVDTDGDGMPDTCVNDCMDSVLTQDDDDDNDGVPDHLDDFTPPAYNYYESRAASVDTDGDGMPDSWNDGSNGSIVCDVICQQLSGLTLDNDNDNDGVPNDLDAFPLNPAASVDADGDGMPDAWNIGCDLECQNNSGLTLDPSLNDFDNDGVVDSEDDFPTNPAAAVDTDGDGKPDAWLPACDETCQNNSGLTLDDDDDDDGVPDVDDAFPLNAAASVDDDQDGLPDAWNASCDLNCQQNSGLTLDPYPNDTNNDGIPNDPGNPLADDDGDGIPNGEDAEPYRDNNPPKVTAPADIEISATGTLTSVSLGRASAYDIQNGEQVELLATADNRGPFTLGVHIITWTAVDAAGNVGSDTQKLTILEGNALNGGGSGGTGSSGSSGGGGSLGLITLLLLLFVRVRPFSFP